MGLEDANVYLAKTETALKCLASMSIEQQQHVRVSACALQLRQWHLLGLVRILFRVFKPLMRANLVGTHPCQTLFTLYKLGFYSSICKG